MSEPRTIMTGIVFGESPRWHDGRLWFSDWARQEIIMVTPSGHSETVLSGPDNGFGPACIDWLPDGRLLLVSGRRRALLRREADGTFATHADLSTAFEDEHWNEVNVDSRGNAFVNGDLQVEGRCLFRGAAVTVFGTLVAPNIGINMYMTDNSLYLRNNGDNNHYLRYANGYAGQTGFDGPLLAGVNGGILAAFGNWTLRWNGNGSVQTRGSISQGSDRNIKENFASVDPDDVLSRVAALPITRWNYKDDPSAEHMGPVAQDFRAAFGLGSDDKSIYVVDSDGVALAAIQGLNKKVDEKSSELLDLVKRQSEQIDLLKAEIEALKGAK